MKSNLKVSNIVMSGRIPLNRMLSIKDYDRLIDRFDWMYVERGENVPPRYSKKFYIRGREEISVHNKIKAPHVTLFHKGGIIIVGLKTQKEGHVIYEKVLSELKKVCPTKLGGKLK